MAHDIVEHFDVTCAGIDGKHAGMRGIGEGAGAAARLVDRTGFERGLLADRQPLRMKVRRVADLGKGDALLAEINSAVGKPDRIARRLQQMRANARDLLR